MIADIIRAKHMLLTVLDLPDIGPDELREYEELAERLDQHIAALKAARKALA
jgi:hypothetical protein